MRQSDTFADWLDNLRDRKAQERISMRLVRLSAGLFGDTKVIGEEVSELRIDYGLGYRVYFVRKVRRSSSFCAAVTKDRKIATSKQRKQ